MFCCLTASTIGRMRFTTQWRAAFRVKSFKAVVVRTASTARALLCMADAEFRVWVVDEAIVARAESEHCCTTCGFHGSGRP